MKAPLVFVLVLAARLSSAHGGPPDSYKDAVLLDKPSAFYRLSEATNTEPVADEVGRNPGEYVNAPHVAVPGAIATDRSNTAVSFAREHQQHIKLTELGGFGSGLSSGFTVEYWLKTKDSSDHQAILGAANGPGYNTDFVVDIADEGKEKRLRIYGRDERWNRFEANFYPEDDNINIFDDHWHYIVHVYEPKAGADNEQIRFYIDGVRHDLSGFFKGGAPQFSDFNNPVTLGAMNLRGAKDDHLEGALDDVAFYLRPLTGAQIKSHYRAAGGQIKGEVEANLLTNGNFDKGTTGWGFFNWGKNSKMEIDAHELHDGKPALRVENFDSCHSYVRQIIRAKPNTRYRLTGYIKTGDIEPANPGQRVGAVLEIGTRAIYTAPLMEKNMPWTRVTVDFSTTDTGEIRVGPSFGTPAFMTGTAWFADLSLVELDGGDEK